MDDLRSIRDATPADLQRLVDGNAAMALETEGLTLDRPTLRAGVEAVLTGARRGRYFVVEGPDGAPAAQLMVTFEWSDWRNAMVWWIQSVYVWPEHRRRGHYRALYAHVLEASRAAGAAGVRLYVDTRNARAQATYEALGMDGGHYRVFEAMHGPPDAG